MLSGHSALTRRTFGSKGRRFVLDLVGSLRSHATSLRLEGRRFVLDPRHRRANPRDVHCAGGPMAGLARARMLARTMPESSSQHNPSAHDVDLLVAGGDVVTMNARREV